MKVFFAADEDAELWPHFHAHYTSLGFTEFICLSAGSPLKSGGDLRVVQFQREPAVSYFRSLHHEFQKLVREANIKPDDWYALTELDEYHKYPLPLRQILDQCERKGCTAILGNLIDKVAADGSLPPLRQDVPLEEQFPATSHITWELARSCLDKVMMCRGYRLIGGGNHNILDSARVWQERYEVYHYKWHANIIKRLKERIAMPTDDGEGWIKGNRMCLEHWERTGSVLV